MFVMFLYMHRKYFSILFAFFPRAHYHPTEPRVNSYSFVSDKSEKSALAGSGQPGVHCFSSEGCTLSCFSR